MVKIEDVARRAGVSSSTVSRALARPELVSQSTRERVTEAARTLGYKPNELARSLRKGSSQIIGLIVTDILNPFHATLAKGVQDAAEERGYRVFIFNSDESPAKEANYLAELRLHLPAGLILVPTVKSSENLGLVKGLPTVELDRTSGTEGISRVLVDNVGGANAAVEHLMALGHTRIGMVAGRAGLTTADERIEGYRQAMLSGGLAIAEGWIRYGDHREDGGYAATSAILSLPPDERPTALFVGNNEMAVGAVRAIRDLGLRLPGDVSLVSFDDSRWAALLDPALTVVAQPTYELGYSACELLISELGSKRKRPAKVMRLETKLIVRASTASAPPTQAVVGKPDRLDADRSRRLTEPATHGR